MYNVTENYRENELKMMHMGKATYFFNVNSWHHFNYFYSLPHPFFPLFIVALVLIVEVL
jgi:hypothetical protein